MGSNVASIIWRMTVAHAVASWVTVFAGFEYYDAYGEVGGALILVAPLSVFALLGVPTIGLLEGDTEHAGPVICGVLMYVAIAAGVWRFQRTVPARATVGDDAVCPACGYDCRATPERCPECGRFLPFGKVDLDKVRDD